MTQAGRTPRPVPELLDLRSLEKTLLSLEWDQGIRSRRLPSYRSNSLMRDLEKRVSRLEQHGLR